MEIFFNFKQKINYFFAAEFLFTVASYQNLKYVLYFNKLPLIFSGKIFSTTLRFPIWIVYFSIAQIVKTIFKRKTFFKQIPILEDFLPISTIRNSRVIGIVFLGKKSLFIKIHPFLEN